MIPLSGSERTAVAGAREIGPANSTERIDVTIILRRKPSAKQRLSLEELGRIPPRERMHPSRDEFAASQGADDKDLKKIIELATESGFVVKSTNKATRSIILSGTVGQFATFFGVELRQYEHPEIQGKTFRGRSGSLYIPKSIADAVVAVLGLDNRPQATSHVRGLLPGKVSSVSYHPPDLAKIYDFPQGVDGSGECVGIIELGGGTNPQDLQEYFPSIGVPQPKVVSVSIDGGANSPTGDPSGPDGEVMLDVEVAGSIASGATIALYFAPNTDQGFVDAVTGAIHDSQNKPSVISISWGSPENNWTTQAINSLNQALEDAANLGVTVCVAAGDGGSSDGESDGLAHVDFPASSPYVLGCGGTTLQSLANEAVWNDQPQDGATGGGVSDVFSLPSWQSKANVPRSANPGGRIGRGVPDVSGDADPGTGYSIRVDGQDIVLGGTSAVAPLWAGLIALMNQKLGHSIGYFNPTLYEGDLPMDLHDITKGNNGAYSAVPGWNACTGFGSPDGSKLLNSILNS